MNKENQSTRHAVLVFQHSRLVYSNPRAAALMACQLEELDALLGTDPLEWAHPDDRRRLQAALQAVLAGDRPSPEVGVRLKSALGEGVVVDAYLSSTLYQGEQAVQVLWIERAPYEERQRLVEDDVMRDILAALASAADMEQALEIILVNLHTLIHYDRVGLFLSEESQRALAAGGAAPEPGRSLGIASGDNPLVAEFQRIGEPIIVDDVQVDGRFSSWSDMGPVRGWLGAPLLAGQLVIGFLSMGSLEAGAYGSSDVELMKTFAAQVAEVLEKAWNYEQTRRRTEQLEVLSNITFALGQAESRADTLSAIVAEITRFFGAHHNTLLLADQANAHLLVKVTPESALLGHSHPRGDDLLWKVFDTRQTSVIVDMDMILADQADELYAWMFGDASAAALIPLTSVDRVFGVLCLAFDRPRQFSFQDVRLYDTIAEIAGTSLQRSIMLRTLERQVDIRTAHLSTLYEINTVAGEPLELEIALERVLNILLGSMGGWAGVIHLLDNEVDELLLSVQQGLPLDRLTSLASLSLAQDSWRELLFAAEPLVVPDVRAAVNVVQDLPTAIRFSLPGSEPTYLGVPIRAEGRVLGLLSVFGANVLENAVENLALLMTITDQIGGYIERAGLIRQAERAAVFEERQRLARELHDSVTQLLYSQVLFSGAGSKVLGQGNTTMAEEHLTRINQAALQALKEMRLLVFELRPSADLDEGLVKALDRRLDSVERRMGVDVSLEVTGHLDIDSDQQVALYRIAEEALNNTLKHAEARTVKVKLESEIRRFTLEVIDDGRGFDPDFQRDRGGMGLSNMQARAAELGGAFHLKSSAGQGTQIRVILVLED